MLTQTISTLNLKLFECKAYMNIITVIICIGDMVIFFFETKDTHICIYHVIMQVGETVIIFLKLIKMHDTTEASWLIT